MAQDYIIKDVKKGGLHSSGYGDFQGYALAISDFGEPVKYSKSYPVDVEPKIGDVIYGSLIEEKTDTRTYYRLQQEIRPELANNAGTERWMWAIAQAVQLYMAGDMTAVAYDNIPKEAKYFYTMLINLEKETTQ